MSWNSEWGGRATDFSPELLKTTGAPGRVAHAAKEAAHEAAQTIASTDSLAWVRITAHGHEDKSNPGAGLFQLTVQVLDHEPSEIEQAIESNKPIDLRS